MKSDASPPVDPIYGSPVHYRRLSGTGMLLYSLGPNGRDDRGSHQQRSIYRGVEMQDWWAISSEKDADRAKQFLAEAGGPFPPPEFADPHSWIPADADDISWRTPPKVESVKGLIDRLIAEQLRDVDGEMQIPSAASR